MGNSQGLKIKNYDNNEILRDIKLNDNQKIIPYVHFISKLNRFQVENFPKNHLIKEFTIINIITEKQNVIHIDNMESGYFLKGLEYSFENIPEKNEFILITNVLEKSVSEDFKIKPKFTILLGDEEKYFDSLDNISSNLKSKKFKFLFYDIMENKTLLLDYADIFQNLPIDKISLGIECCNISRLKLLKLLDKILKENHAKSENYILNKNFEDFKIEKDENKGENLDKIEVENVSQEKQEDFRINKEKTHTQTQNSNKENKNIEISNFNITEINNLSSQKTDNLDKNFLKSEGLLPIYDNDSNTDNKTDNAILKAESFDLQKEPIKIDDSQEKENLDAFDKNENILEVDHYTNSKRKQINNLLNEKEIIRENELPKNETLIENKIDNLRGRFNSDTNLIIPEQTSDQNEVNQGDKVHEVKEQIDFTKVHKEENLINEEVTCKSKNDKINIIINRNVINLTNRKIEKKYMKNLLVYDFIDPKSNKIDFLKNTTNDKINEKYVK